MFVETREYKKIECDLELEQMFEPFQPRKDSQFHLKSCDKPDYSILIEKNEKQNSIIKH